MSACSAPPAGSGLVTAMTRFIDCQAEYLGTGAWAAFAAPGSTLSIVLAGFLTLFVAITGYTLLLGGSLTVRSGTLAFVKIGMVLALATSWPAWRTLVYDLVVDGPAQIVGEIGGPARLPGSDGTLVQRLDMADRALASLSILGPGAPVHASAEAAQSLVPPPFAGFNAFALGGTRILFLITAIGALAVVRITVALMLALGPFFIAFLLFDNTRSLFEGWVRVIAGAALAAIGAAVALGLQLAMLEPWLSAILVRRIAGEALPSVPAELLVVITVFAVLTVALLIASARIARAFRLAPILRLADKPQATAQSETSDTVVRPLALDPGHAQPGRAAAVAGAVAAAERREARAIASSAALHDQRQQQAATGMSGGAPGAGLRVEPIGRTFSRRTRTRISAGAARRDRRA